MDARRTARARAERWGAFAIGASGSVAAANPEFDVIYCVIIIMQTD
jgi:hypothetical protein